MLTGLAQVLGENQLERIELRENLRTEDCVCPGEGQLVRVLRGYLRQLLKLPAKTIIVEPAHTSNGLCKSKEPDTSAPALMSFSGLFWTALENQNFIREHKNKTKKYVQILYLVVFAPDFKV